MKAANPIRKILPWVAALGLTAAASAQVVVTGVTYGATTNGTNRAVDNLTYNNDSNAVSIIDTANGNYVFSSAPGAAVDFRRNTAANNNATVFYQYTGTFNATNTSLHSKGDLTPTLNEVMLSNDLTQGLWNPFANVDSGNAALSSNIERIDFSLPNFTVTNVQDGFVFFDLENNSNFGDGFRIAAYTATGTVNGVTAPTTYANTGLLIAADSFGNAVATPTGTDATYLRSTTTFGNNLYNSSNINQTNQTMATVDTSSTGGITGSDLVLVGILIRFSDLGLNAGDVIQGYSLIASDTVVSTASDLVDWQNSAVYLTNTNASSSAGNMDFMGFGSQISRYVPEPSTYGLMFTGAACALAAWRRRQRKTRA